MPTDRDAHPPSERHKVGQKYEFSFELPEKYAGQYITIMVYLLPLDF